MITRELLEQRIAGMKRGRSDRGASQQDVKNAIREVFQEGIVHALARHGFFQKGAFHGGTCLRIFHSLPRFSADIDLSLLAHRVPFGLKRHFEPMLGLLARSLTTGDLEFSVEDLVSTKEHWGVSMSARIVEHRAYRSFGVGERTIIKVELDATPPAGAEFENHYGAPPFESCARTHDLPSILAGKIHAILCRQDRSGRLAPHGRDWFDFAYLVGQGVHLNPTLLRRSLRQRGPWKGKALPRDLSGWLLKELSRRFEETSLSAMRDDVLPLLSPGQQEAVEETWSPAYFIYRAKQLLGKPGVLGRAKNR